MRPEKRKIAWREPADFHRRRYRDELRRMGVLSPWFWIRPPLIGAVVLILALLYNGWQAPGVPLDFPVGGTVAIWLCFQAMLVLLLLYPVGVPRRVVVTRSGVFASSPSRQIPARLIDAFVLDRADQAGLMLVVRYRSPNKKHRELRSLLPPSVDLDRLAQSLPERFTLETREQPPQDARDSDIG